MKTLNERHQVLFKYYEKTAYRQRRHDPRESCTIKLHYVSHYGTYCGLIRNISLGGIFIETQDNFFVGEEIRMKIPFSDSKRFLEISGKVVRKNPNGIGVVFRKRGRQRNLF